MSSNELLGSELRFEEDPFISGAITPQQNDKLFNGIYGDSSLFEHDLFFGEDGQMRKEDDEYGYTIKDDSFSYPFGMQEMTDMNGYDVYGNFDFSDEVVTAGEQTEPCINQPIPTTTENELHHTPNFNTTGPITIDANNAGTSMNHETTYAAPKVYSNPPVAESNKHHPYKSVKPVQKKAKALFPVKISKVLPQHGKTTSNRTTLGSMSSPYALAPSYQRSKPITQQQCAQSTFENENHPLLTAKKHTMQSFNIDSNGAGEDTTQKLDEPSALPINRAPTVRLKMSSIVPRDVASNHIKCTMCQGSFTTQLALEFHEVERHPQAFVFKCTICADIFATIGLINKHLVTEHRKETVPLLDNAIFGNGALSDYGKKSSQRRISGMIWSFVSSHLAQSGKLTGTTKDNETIKKEAKVLFNPLANRAVGSRQSGVTNASASKVCVDESASINDLLKQAYIYGPSVHRLPINSVPMYKVIRCYEPDFFSEEMQNRYLARNPPVAPDAAVFRPKMPHIVLQSPSKKQFTPATFNNRVSYILKPGTKAGTTVRLISSTKTQPRPVNSGIAYQSSDVQPQLMNSEAGIVRYLN
ncbi:C2H2-type domain-containing protein [Caenorhabditis elegans]|uniref:C2H2-type domain-containing protein n=1 Tax=Caenorhabditis elegans TaxID=6239 RepID=Q21406_CAEEL|nr:C2H2-type domain-containing protein [Caenorhabditis elegans]CCD64598.2 C2H2-type domain-containing protein [Caenorhabditis elegans]